MANATAVPPEDDSYVRPALPRATKVIYAARVLVGAIAVAAGLLGVFLAWGTLGSDPALQFSVLFFGGFVLLHAGLDYVFREMVLHTVPASDSDPTTGLRGAISALIATPAAVLGLVAVFGTHITNAFRVGAVSLVLGVLLSAMLSMFVVLPVSSETDAPTTNFISALLQLSLWATVFGLACVGAGIVYAVGGHAAA